MAVGNHVRETVGGALSVTPPFDQKKPHWPVPEQATCRRVSVQKQSNSGEYHLMVLVRTL